jgi:hypothetical protein
MVFLFFSPLWFCFVDPAARVVNSRELENSLAVQKSGAQRTHSRTRRNFERILHALASWSACASRWPLSILPIRFTRTTPDAPLSPRSKPGHSSCHRAFSRARAHARESADSKNSATRLFRAQFLRVSPRVHHDRRRHATSRCPHPNPPQAHAASRQFDPASAVHSRARLKSRLQCSPFEPQSHRACSRAAAPANSAHSSRPAEISATGSNTGRPSCSPSLPRFPIRRQKFVMPVFEQLQTGCAPFHAPVKPFGRASSAMIQPYALRSGN